jgi:hypothetical protein
MVRIARFGRDWTSLRSRRTLAGYGGVAIVGSREFGSPTASLHWGIGNPHHTEVLLARLPLVVGLISGAV